MYDRVCLPSSIRIYPRSPAATADPAGEGEEKRGLLDAPFATSTPSASTPSASTSAGAPPAQPVAADAHAGKGESQGHSSSPLKDNLLGEDEDEDEDEGTQGGVLGEGGKRGLLTTETTRGARLAVEDVSVVTPTGDLIS